MIKCPKCSFEQPEDIYCANCGVNMKTYRAVPTPLIKVLLSSWMTKVALLTLLIIGFLIYDLQKRSRHQEAAYVSQNANNRFTKTASDYEAVPSSAPAQEPAPAPAAGAVRTHTASQFKPAARIGNPSPNEGVDSMPPPASGAARKPILKVSFYSGSRGAVQELHRDSQSSASGDVNGGTTPLKKLQTLTGSGELKSIISNRYKDFDAQSPIVIFKGQRGADATKNLGLYFQITPLRQDGNSLQLEIKSWGNVKLQGTDENLFTSEITLNPQAAAFIAGFLPKERTFSDEEKTVFESDRVLKIYNQEDFLDGTSDLIMVIEMTLSP